MLPSLSPLSGSPTSRVDVSPPPSFRPLSGPPYGAEFCSSLTFAGDEGTSAAQRTGLRYEKKVQERLASLFPAYVPSPSISFYDASGRRFIIPDGLLNSPLNIVIFEIKFQHCPEAWWQLRRLYEPVVQTLFPNRSIATVEVCRTYDPATPFPEEVELVSDLRDFIVSPTPKFGVYRWK